MHLSEILQEKNTRTLVDDPQYFGGYLNMARHNIYNISNYFAQEFNKSLLEEEGRIANSFLKNSDPKINWRHVFSKVVRFMPFIKVFNFEQLPEKYRVEIENDPDRKEGGLDYKRMRETLGILFKEIQDLRNDYSHYYSTDNANKRKLLVSHDAKIFLNEIFNLAIEYTKERMKDVLCDDDYSLVENKVIVGTDNKITTEGLVFLICIFLEKEHAYQFISKIKGLKGTQFSSFIATREVFMSYCVKLPHDKFVSEDIKQALTLDMISELNRCPKELYNVITDEEKKRFRPELEIDKQQSLIDNSINKDSAKDWDEPDYDNYIEQLTKRIRFGNRFPYFALRYIDDMDIFKDWRFHINFGKIELANYKKTFAGEEEERRIIEDVKGFRKLRECMERKKSYELIDKKNYAKDFYQFKPHYNINNNKIGLRKYDCNAKLKKKQDDSNNIPYTLKQHLPDAFLSIHELPKVILLEYLKKGSVEQIISGFVGINKSKLNNKDFIEEIKSKLPSDWEEFQKETAFKNRGAYSDGKLDYLKLRKVILNEVLKEHELNDKQIPTRILNYWLNISDVDIKRSFSDRVKLMRKDCKQRLKVMKNHKVDPKARIPKVGEMATFLAKDIVDMIVEKERKIKFTSFYYDMMQECFAFYADDEKKKILEEIIKEFNLNSEGGHPFLSNVIRMSPRNTKDFYTLYLKEKADKRNNKRERDTSWMEKTFYTLEYNQAISKKMTVVRMPDNKSNIPYTILQWKEKEIEDLEKWLQNVTTINRKPVDLPTNLFDTQLKELLISELDKSDIKYSTDLKLNELLKLWWEGRGDGVQDFYDAEREYTVYDEKVNFTPNSRQRFKSYYRKAFENIDSENRGERKKPVGSQLESVFKRAIGGTEKKIRILQEEDKMMLLMIEQMMDNNSENMENVYLFKVDKLLNEAVSVEIELNYDKEGNIIIGEQVPAISRTLVSNSKRKNYTLLRKYRFDRRLSGLLEYHKDKRVQLDWLEKELAAYNKVKQIVFDLIFTLEKYIIERDGNGLKDLYVDKCGVSLSGNISHWPYLKWLEKEALINRDEHLFLKSVRNAFSHNQFPREKDIKITGNINDTQPIAEQILMKYYQIISRILNVA